MNRRQFFTRLAAAVPAVALAPSVIAQILEELAPARTIILPPAEGWPDLAEIVRRAFVPRMVMQLYKSSPIVAAMMRNSGGHVVLPGEVIRLAPGEKILSDAPRLQFSIGDLSSG